jgi:hypothetical protein
MLINVSNCWVYMFFRGEAKGPKIHTMTKAWKPFTPSIPDNGFHAAFTVFNILKINIPRNEPWAWYTLSYLPTSKRVLSTQRLQLWLFLHAFSMSLFSWTTKIRIWRSTLQLGDQLGSNIPVRAVCSAFQHTEQSRRVNLDLPHTVILRRIKIFK